MSKIVIKGSLSQIQDEKDFDFLRHLDNHLSFKIQGAEYSRAFKGWVDKDGKFQKWDGIHRILTEKLTFPTGLVDRVVNFYKNYNKEISIEDIRPEKSKGIPIDIISKLVSMNKSPYPYQLDVLNAVDKNERGIIKLPTGAGKSIVAALVTAKLGKKTIIYVIGKDLLYQFHDLFSSIFDEKIGIIGDGNCDIQNINIASIWTIGQALGLKKADIILDDSDDEKPVNIKKYNEILNLIKNTKLHMIDECHMAACTTIQKIYKTSNAEHIYGLSGSPWRDDNADLLIESILGKYIVNVSASYLIKEGFLAQPIIKFIKVPPLAYKLPRNYPTVYREYISENIVRNNLILANAKKLIDKGYQVLILFNSIKHGRILYDLISPEIDCAILDGSDSQEIRSKVKNNLLAGNLKCVLASKIFDIGVDIPSLSALIVGCGGKSTVKALQRVGRVIRRYPGKKFAAVIDFYDDATFLKDHSKVRYKIYSSEEGFSVKWPE